MSSPFFIYSLDSSPRMRYHRDMKFHPDRRTTRIYVRLAVTENEFLHRAAKYPGLTFSEWARAVLLRAARLELKEKPPC